jgi:hypothetical protein
MLELLVAQALVERGLLDSVAAGVARLRYQLELYVGEGRAPYLLIGGLILLLLLVTRRPRYRG